MKLKVILKHRKTYSLKCFKHFSHSDSLYKASPVREKKCLICLHIQDNPGYSTKLCRGNIKRNIKAI